ncbi:MAG: NAD-dependent epimerase/dehydratase family protein [Alphaproteobacteria bacterium]|nr:NAD-dependent epimerase/dehydratase family protein [Alphaproteobacteria bacterium]MCB9792007.1 NAD-dependent epimerase/dehydratase family protein [Alphaproteobacteria bacterium]
MKVAVTGATGLVGANLAAALLEAGHSLRCTRRASSHAEHLDHLDIEWVEAPLGEPQALKRAFAGCEQVYHCAAATLIVPYVTPTLTAVNVTGTENVIRALEPGARLIHCSSVVAVGVSDDGRPVDEEAPWNHLAHGLADGYAITKRQAEAIVHAAVGQGLDAVIVNPTYMFGPYDARPSSGQLILDVLNGKVPGHSPGVNNFVDVRRVVAGMIAAGARGRRGERYILGDADMSYQEVMALIAEVAGVSPPARGVPEWVAKGVGFLGDAIGFVTGRMPDFNSTTMAWAYAQGPRYTSAKAVRELGYAPGSVREGVEAALEWFRANGRL